MPTYSRHDVVLIRYPFADVAGAKVRPAVVVSAPHESRDLIIAPLTSRTSGLLAGELVLGGWAAACLNVASALERLSGRAVIAAAADDKMALEGEGGHGAFTAALLEGLSGKADFNNNGTIEVSELADYIEQRLPEITRKWGYEQFPVRETSGQSFSVLPRPPQP